MTPGPSIHTIPGFHERLKLVLSRKFGTEFRLPELTSASLGISRAGVRNWIVGHTYPSVPHLFMLAKLCECSTDWLLFGDAQNTLGDDAKLPELC